MAVLATLNNESSGAMPISLTPSPSPRERGERSQKSLRRDFHSKKIALRVDASRQIGTGHFMRCLALANALQNRGVRTRFVSRHLPKHLGNKLADKGHELVLFNATPTGTHARFPHPQPLSPRERGENFDELAHAAWLGVSQSQDAVDSIQALSDQKWDWLIVDHYALDSRWESMLRQTANKILAIDDIDDRQHDCDVLLDQNLYADMETRYARKTPTYCQLLLGPQYALLRDEFGILHKKMGPRTGPVKRILVFLGGIDAQNYTSQVIEAFAQQGMTGIHVDVVIGAEHPARKQIETACVRYGFKCYVQTERMADLMATADLAIGAGGSACWERCCLGLPAILIALADNQINIAKALDWTGACIYLGTAKLANARIIQNTVIELLNNPARVEQLSKISYSLVDGLGAGRVCKKMGV